MKDSFAKVVEKVKNLSAEQKLELQNLIENYLGEERRQEIYENQQESLRELKEGELVFSGETDYLRGSMRS
ncbi:MAG TPA: hypothetical protein VGO96_03885 [Pyrinomonadaceae bacterium]|jgi:hypothetical protein|nr:hypothetical protein [Pyrinomonadaceae bacterium]